MTKKQSETLTAGTRVLDTKYGKGEGTVTRRMPTPGYWAVEFDNGERFRFGYRNLALI